MTAARTSLIFYRIALNQHDKTTGDLHRMDIEMIRIALVQFGDKFKIGQHHSQLIEYFLDRCATPTLEKVMAHYPEHPRIGAYVVLPGCVRVRLMTRPELGANADLGACVLNALNIKRGFWYLPRSANGLSPFSNNTPESMSAHPPAPSHRSSLGASASPHGQNSTGPSPNRDCLPTSNFLGVNTTSSASGLPNGMSYLPPGNRPDPFNRLAAVRKTEEAMKQPAIGHISPTSGLQGSDSTVGITRETAGYMPSGLVEEDETAVRHSYEKTGGWQTAQAKGAI